jgi:hypothetical protein
MSTVIISRDDCRTLPELRRIGRELGMRSNNWRTIAARLAALHGRVIVWRCDDTMVTFSHENGRTSRRSLRPNAWRFTADWYASPR